MRKPSLTTKVLEGLSRAYSHMEADDLTDLTDEEADQFEAAGEWLAQMWAWKQTIALKPRCEGKQG